MTSAELIAFLLDPPTDPADDSAARLAAWVRTSRRFHTFAEDNRTKIRKKLRAAQTPDTRQSVLLELDIARHFVSDTRCQVAYETQSGGKTRGPDLTVTFRDNTTLHLEATRIALDPETPVDQADKLIRVVGSKLGQIVPQASNTLVIAADTDAFSPDSLASALKTLRQRLDQHDPTLPPTLGNDPAAFHKRFRWQSALTLCAPATPAVVWTNPQARRPLPPDLLALLQALTLSTA